MTENPPKGRCSHLSAWPMMVSLSVLLLAGCGGSTSDSASDGHSHSHGVSDIVPGVWPPQLADISNERSIALPVRNRGADAVVASARSSLLNNPNIQSLLGSRYAEFESTAGGLKDDFVARFVFYNYLDNTTIDVSFTSDASIEHEVFPAQQYQPSENTNEIEQAINIAAAQFESDNINLAGLTGTAMLAFPALAGQQAVTTDSQYYAERVLYVTFGVGDGAEPQYRALVNLSQQNVISSGEIL